MMLMWLKHPRPWREYRMWEGKGVPQSLTDPSVKPKSDPCKTDLEKGRTCSDVVVPGHPATAWRRDWRCNRWWFRVGKW